MNQSIILKCSTENFHIISIHKDRRKIKEQMLKEHNQIIIGKAKEMVE